MFPIAKTQICSTEAVSNLINAATRMDTTAFGMVLKVRGNVVLNWMYADADTLRPIAALRGDVRFRQADNVRLQKTLRELILSLSEKTPFIALMIRYEGKQPTANSWEFVDLDFLKNLTA